MWHDDDIEAYEEHLTSLPQVAREPHHYEAYTVKKFQTEVCAICLEIEASGPHICDNCGEFPMTYNCFKARC